MNRNLIVLLIPFAFCAIFLEAGGRKPSSALHLHEKRSSPPQIIDMGLYDDVIQLKCGELKDYLSFSGSKLTPIVKCKVSYYCDTKHDRSAPERRYEDIWYRKGDPIGLKRLGPLAIKRRDRVAVFLEAKSNRMSEAEITACANILVRLRLDLTLNQNLIVTVRVPGQAFDGLIAELRKQNFFPYKQLPHPIDALIPIPLETETGTREVVCYLPCE